MPAPIHIDLTAEEDRTLQELSLANGVQRRIKLRAIGLRLNADGWTVPQIAAHLKQSEHTIRNTIKRWCTGGVGGLWEASGRGLKQRWTDADINTLEQWLTEERSYSAQQLSEKLAQERGVHLGRRRLQRILQKRAGSGNDCELARHSQNPLSTTVLSTPIG